MALRQIGRLNGRQLQRRLDEAAAFFHVAAQHPKTQHAHAHLDGNEGVHAASEGDGHGRSNVVQLDFQTPQPGRLFRAFQASVRVCGQGGIVLAVAHRGGHHAACGLGFFKRVIADGLQHAVAGGVLSLLEHDDGFFNQ